MRYLKKQAEDANAFSGFIKTGVVTRQTCFTSRLREAALPAAFDNGP
jgi:hypothetical protein